MIKVLVDRLNEGPETLEINSPASELGIESESAYQFNSPITGSVEFKLIGRDVQALGSLGTSINTQCVRCLVPITVPLKVPVEAVWMFHDPKAQDYEVPAPDEILAEYYDGDILYPAETLRELILADLPDFPLCKEDCKGLCPACGVNRNTDKCTCAGQPHVALPESGGSDWKAALRKLKPEL